MPCIRVYVGVGGKQAVNPPQDDEQVCVNEIRHKCRQPVVVPEDFTRQLLDCDHIVLVDDGHNPPPRKFHECVSNVDITQAVRYVPLRDKPLRDRNLLPAEQLLVGVHQVTLTDSGKSLLQWQVAPIIRHPKYAPACSHRPGRHQQNLAAPRVQARNLAHKRRHNLDVNMLSTARKQGSPSLHHNTAVTGTARPHRR